jgi:hypothetical protein
VSVRNQYQGINAHLHSLYQAEGGWGGFHTRHIVHLADALAVHLRPMGYVVDIEESLQIRRQLDTPRSYRADILISDRDPAYPARSPLLHAGQWVPVAELIVENELSEKPYRAVTISEAHSRKEPVVWIELLSPSNKGYGEDAEAYRVKRMELLSAGLVFVELDYLHETPPTFSTLPPYYPGKKGQWLPDAHPYRLIVIDPRPDLESGKARVMGFNVDEPIPTLEIPLSGTDTATFDFGIPYQRTFEEGFFGDNVDYTKLPLHFDRYSPADQLRILRRMLAVRKATQNGVDLESAPFPIDETLTLDDALTQLEGLGS